MIRASLYPLAGIEFKKKKIARNEEKNQENHYQRSNGNRILVYYLISTFEATFVIQRMEQKET